MPQQRSDYDFRFHGRPTSHEAFVEYVSTIQRICGQLSTERQFAAGIKKIIRRWRLRLVELRAAGWKRVDTPKFAYARNCRPAGAKMIPEAKACNLRICPFCHARSVAKIYSAVQGQVSAYVLASQAVRVISHTQCYDREDTQDIIRLDPQQAAYDYHDVILPRHRLVQRRFRRDLVPAAYGGFSWFALEPRMHDEHVGDVLGRWAVTHGHVAIVPASWEPYDTVGRLRVLAPDDAKDLAFLVGVTFPYPLGWLSGDAVAVASMVTQLARSRILSRFGVLRGRT